MTACNYIDSTLLDLPCPMPPLTLSQYSSCTSRSSSRSSVGPELPARDLGARSRDAATARALSHLSPRSPYAITRESVSLHSRYQSSETPSASRTCLCGPGHQHKHQHGSKHTPRQLTISTFLWFRCFGSRDPTQASTRPCANQYILSSATLLSDPTCARSRANSFQCTVSFIKSSRRNETALSCMRWGPSMGMGGG